MSISRLLFCLVMGVIGGLLLAYFEETRWVYHLGSFMIMMAWIPIFTGALFGGENENR